MNTLLITIHVISCFVLILVVLLQAGRGADMGAAFGGASTPMFGSGSSVNPLTRITTATAITFLATALILAVSSARRASVFDSTAEPFTTPPVAESSAPAGVPPASPQAQAIPQPRAIPATPPAAQPLTIPAAPGAPAASDEAAPAGEPAAAPEAAPKAAAPAEGAPAGAAPAEQPAH